MRTITIGEDSAKLLFSICEVDPSGRVLPATMLPLLADLNRHWHQVRDRIAECDQHIATHAKLDERSVRAQQIIGIGPLTADALVATVGSARVQETDCRWRRGCA